MDDEWQVAQHGSTSGNFTWKVEMMQRLLKGMHVQDDTWHFMKMTCGKWL